MKESDSNRTDTNNDSTESDQTDSDQLTDEHNFYERYENLPEKIDDQEVASDIESFLSSVETLVTDLEQAREESDRIKSQLDQERSEFKNYRSRMDERQEEVHDQAIKGLVEELIDVRTNLTRALADEQDDIESLRDGVRITLQQFDSVFESEDVSEINPEPGDEIDPARHEIIRRIASEQPDNTVTKLHEPGYEFSDELLQPAKVTVSSSE